MYEVFLEGGWNTIAKHERGDRDSNKDPYNTGEIYKSSEEG